MALDESVKRGFQFGQARDLDVGLARVRPGRGVAIEPDPDHAGALRATHVEFGIVAAMRDLRRRIKHDKPIV